MRELPRIRPRVGGRAGPCFHHAQKAGALPFSRSLREGGAFRRLSVTARLVDFELQVPQANHGSQTVIPSEASGSRSESDAESRDPVRRLSAGPPPRCQLKAPPSRKEREKGRAPAFCVVKAWASPPLCP